MNPPERPDEEMARIWREMANLRVEQTKAPDTIENYQRGLQISDRLEKLEARYKELAGGLYYGTKDDET